MKADHTVSETDARAMVRLLGETAAVEGGHIEKKRFLMDGLCKLVGADAWSWSLNCDTRPGSSQSFISLLHGGITQEQVAKILHATEHEHANLTMRRFYEVLASKRSLVTMSRDEVDHEGLSYQGEFAQRWEAAGIGPMVLAAYPVDDVAASGMILYRRHGAEPFSEREINIMHIVWDEVPWLHRSGWPEDRGATVPQLYPRQRTVMNLLLDGMSRKAIAAHLGISENTVSGYVKEIYRHFGVSSQPELMRKFLLGESSVSTTK
ncbi:MAG: helix-turn-helix transcriptional regulator [Puniceicoccales bacterium]